MLRRSAIAATMLAVSAIAAAGDAQAGAQDEAIALYERFAAAQNRQDTVAVRQLLLPSDRFLWVSDGKAFWGPDAMIDRMSGFQRAEVWKVEPDRARRRVVSASDDQVHLYQPLTLRIGAAAAPDAIPFLVSMLAVRTPDGWRIAALLTTVEKP